MREHRTGPRRAQVTVKLSLARSSRSTPCFSSLAAQRPFLAYLRFCPEVRSALCCRLSEFENDVYRNKCEKSTISDYTRREQASPWPAQDTSRRNPVDDGGYVTAAGNGARETSPKYEKRTRSHPNRGVLTRCCLPLAAIELSVFISSSSSVMSWKADAVSFRFLQFGKVRETTHLEVRLDAACADRLGQDDDTALGLVRDEDGSGRDAVLGRDGAEFGIGQERRVCARPKRVERCPHSSGSTPEAFKAKERTGRAERAVGLHQDAVLVAPRL